MGAQKPKEGEELLRKIMTIVRRLREKSLEAKLMHSGQAVRKEPKPMRFDALITDEEVLIDYMDTRLIRQRPLTPIIVRPFGLGGRDRF